MKKTTIQLLALILIIAVSFAGGMLLTKRTYITEEVGTFNLEEYNHQKIDDFKENHTAPAVYDSNRIKKWAKLHFLNRLDVKTKELEVFLDDENAAWYVCAEIRNQPDKKAHVIYRAEDADILAIWID